MTGYGFLISRAMRFRRELAVISMLTMCGSLVTLALPWLAGQLLGDVVSPQATSTGSIVALLLLALGLTTLINIVSAIVSARTSGRILASLRLESYTRIQELPLAFHDRSRQGDLLALMTYEVASLSAFLTSTLARVPSMLLTAAGAVVLLFVLNPVLAFVVPVLVPVFYIVVRLVGRSLRGISARSREAQAKLMYLAQRDLDILLATKAFAVEERQASIYADGIENARLLTFAYDRISAMLGPLVGLVAALAAVCMLLLAGGDAGALKEDPARLFSFLFYAALLTRPVGSLAEIYGQFQLARGTLARLESVFAEQPEIGYRDMLELEQCKGAVSFENVSFAYNGRDPVLHNASLSIAPGETVALTGENGAGKSTLISLLQRFYEPSAGAIFIDGQDIAGLQVQHLRRKMGYVPQRALLFNGSVRDNIAFGLPGADETQIRDAARLAQALEFIEKLPEGLDTTIGDHGVRLSGGQGQRIALARALIVDPPILILDEATSMYDLEGEAAFIMACQTALKGRTVIIVTHRPASLALADRLFCVEGASVKEITCPQKTGRSSEV